MTTTITTMSSRFTSKISRSSILDEFTHPYLLFPAHTSSPLYCPQYLAPAKDVESHLPEEGIDTVFDDPSEPCLEGIHMQMTQHVPQFGNGLVPFLRPCRQAGGTGILPHDPIDNTIHVQKLPIGGPIISLVRIYNPHGISRMKGSPPHNRETKDCCEPRRASTPSLAPNRYEYPPPHAPSIHNEGYRSSPSSPNPDPERR